jgi:hypothetical protein
MTETRDAGERVPDFDIAEAKISARMLLYGVLAVPVVITLAVALPQVAGRNSPIHLLLVTLLLVGVAVLSAEVVLVPTLGWVRRSSARRLRDAQQRRRTTLWAGAAQQMGLASALGVLTVGTVGVQYRQTMDLDQPEGFVTSWPEVDTVVFRPRLDVGGRLQLRLRDGQRVSWLVRGECRGASNALKELARDRPWRFEKAALETNTTSASAPKPGRDPWPRRTYLRRAIWWIDVPFEIIFVVTGAIALAHSRRSGVAQSYVWAAAVGSLLVLLTIAYHVSQLRKSPPTES